MLATDLPRDAKDLPCILLHGAMETNLLSAAAEVVMRLRREETTTTTGGLLVFDSNRTVRSPVSVLLPDGLQHNTYIDCIDSNTVGCDAKLIKVPSPDESGSTAAFLARCAAVLQMCKDASSCWCVLMCRKVIVVHLACGLPLQTQHALARVIEASTERALFVLTCNRSSICVPLKSMSVFIRVPSSLPPIIPCKAKANQVITAHSRKVVAGSMTMTEVAMSLLLCNNSNTMMAEKVIAACAAGDHFTACIRKLGSNSTSCECRSIAGSYVESITY